MQEINSTGDKKPKVFTGVLKILHEWNGKPADADFARIMQVPPQTLSNWKSRGSEPTLSATFLACHKAGRSFEDIYTNGDLSDLQQLFTNNYETPQSDLLTGSPALPPPSLSDSVGVVSAPSYPDLRNELIDLQREVITLQREVIAAKSGIVSSGVGSLGVGGVRKPSISK